MAIARYILIVISLLSLALSLLIAATTPEMLRGNARFKAGDISHAIEFVESTKKSRRTLPTQAEFREWKLSRGWDNRALFLETTGSMRSEDCPFGEIPKGSYGISMWRGEWFECYSGWSSSYSFDDSLAVNIRAISISLFLSAIAYLASLFVRRLTTRSRGKPPQWAR